MAKFNFKMQSILNLKEKLEAREKITFGILSAKLAEEEEVLQRLTEHKSDLLDLKTSQMTGILNAHELQITENAIFANDLKIVEQKKAIRRAEKALDIQRDKLSEAMKERKTFEKLKENAYKQFLKEVEYEEQKEIDQLVSYRHGRVAM